MKDLLPGEIARVLRRPFEGLVRAEAMQPPGASGAALAEAFLRDPQLGCVLVVVPSPAALESFVQDSQSFNCGYGVVRIFPMSEESGTPGEAHAARVSLLKMLSSKGASLPPLLLLTCVQALMQHSPDPEQMEKSSLSLVAGSEFTPEELVKWLEESGYRREPEVYESGVWSAKGGIVDVWPTGATVPSRVEFFGDEIASIRTFNPADQRSDQKIDSLLVPPYKLPSRAKRYLYDYLPEHSLVMWFGGSGLDGAAHTFAQVHALPEARQLPAIRAKLESLQTLRQIYFTDSTPESGQLIALPFVAVEGIAKKDDPEIMRRQRRDLLSAAMVERKRDGAAVYCCLDTEGMAAHLRGDIAEGAFDIRVAPLSGGFRIVSPTGKVRAVFLAQFDMYGYRKLGGTSLDALQRALGSKRRKRDDIGSEEGLDDMLLREADETEALSARIFENFAPGDLVVHTQKGIGRYRGTTVINSNGGHEEVLVLEYAQGTRLLVPLTQANLITRYTGVDDIPVRLHKLGSKRWEREKLEAAKAVQVLAGTMLMRQARRRALPGFAFDRETPYLQEFEASFPYSETPGQAECIRRVKEDMQKPHPMDRLVCGDAGYGKTEIALRAAFIAAMQGKQVAVLVPTTVLAQQHYALFSARMAPYPLRVAVHSRFVSEAERTAALKGVADGTVDIIIGTHGILARSVTFKDLGLVVIDEEQRFGVCDKERLKEVREMVDVLTLTATPIPRTLYLGLTGARDLSLLRTPPIGRQSVETKVVAESDDILREAVLREVSRGGQVFFLHNRVMTIDLVFKRLQTLFPNLRIAVGHGRLTPAQMRAVMEDFAAGLYDIMLSTTIIENGIDVPRANTIIVDRSDRFGIADLYQLRGRVGRSSTKAYAYFLLPSGAHVTNLARERLDALTAASRLSAGVTLAMRDLSIRGSGNLLGAAQSGHISSIGFNLYCQLLRRAIARLKGEKPPLLVNVDLALPFLAFGPDHAADSNSISAFLPYNYINDDIHRIEFHRRLAECASEQDIASLREEIEDRFGRSPKSLICLYKTTLLRVLCAQRGITRVFLRDMLLYLYRDGAPLRFSGSLPVIDSSDPDKALSSIMRLVRSQTIRN